MGDGAVLVTGGTGFVGRRVVEDLLARGRQVTVAVRGTSLPPEPRPGLRHVVVGEIGRETVWDEALAGISAVVHLAAHVHVAPERAGAEVEIFDEVNRRGSLRLFEAATARGVGSFIQMSSITVLGGESPPDASFDDRTPPRPETPYGRSKLAAEQDLRNAAEDDRCPTLLTILRPPLIAGPGVGGNLGRLARLAALPLPLPLGGIRNQRTLLSLDNLVAAIALVLDRPASGTFVLGDAEPLSTSAILRRLREGAGQRAPLLPLPVGLVRNIAVRLGREGMARRLFDDLAVDSRGFRERFGFRDVVDTATSLRAVGAAVRARR
ncbi:NAD-dependent epimerase/dehydratase family protein [uncultured Enterovirga sp.]|uniref:NAD-dependent epimerase/dehydratase family protein n=1 Tax=uncultured Enterovirga sp. TaxID=2026352 RepID=UPI0035C94E27